MRKTSFWFVALNSVSLGVAALAAMAGGAQAATLYSTGPTVAMETPGSMSGSFGALSGAGTLSLQLQGYATLDGDNTWIDILHITLNGSEVFAGTFDLGGGGIDRVLVNPGAGSVVKDFAARTLDLVLPVTLLSGSNSLTIAYDSPTLFEGVARAGFQGLVDEGWGTNRGTVTGAVPEPTSVAMLLAGLGLIGVAGLARRRPG